MTIVTRQIVGYDPTTERVAFEYLIPQEKWDVVRPLVQPNEDDPHYLYSYPLDTGVAGDIMGLIGERAAPNLRYYLECEAAD